jgi:hypothetical protein
VIGETKGCFKRAFRDYPRADVQSQQLRTLYVSKISCANQRYDIALMNAAANPDSLALPVESAPPPSCTHFERPYWSNRSFAPWVSGFLEATIFKKNTEAGEFEIFSMRDIRAVGSIAARTQRNTITRATAFLALLLIPSLSSAVIYKCTAQDGSITYTDAPCSADMTTHYIDPAAPSWLNESWQNMNTIAALPDVEYQSQPEIMAILCANDEFKVWLKAQRHGLPERDVRTAKFIRLSYLCRRALHLPDVAAPIPPMPLKRVLGQEVP